MEIDKNELLEMLVDRVKMEEVQPDEITIKMFAARTGYSISGAGGYLDNEVRHGNLTRRSALVDGRWVSVYRKAEL